MTTHDTNTGRFADLGISENFLTILTQKGFTTPTPIQHQVIPAGLEGKDVVGIAQTGTGKTLAFGIPMIQRLGNGTGRGLILAPTRELAIQIETELLKVAAPLGLKTAVLIGGAPQGKQIAALRKKPHIVIATPGRLVDFMEQREINLGNVSIVALDEADRMLDVGFLPQIKKILATVPKERQTLLFSATMPKEISGLAAAYMKMPLRIEIAPQGTAAQHVEQELFIIPKPDKMRLLDHILQENKNLSTLVFSRTKHGAKKIARDIRGMGHTADEIHSNRTQNQRQKALDGFRKGKVRILVATDIAARGIDVKDIGIVINFDLPDNAEDYVHRIGRTGRAGKSGKAISFAAPNQKADIKKIERLIRKTLPVLSLPKALPAPRPKPAYEERSTQAHGRPPRGGGYASRNTNGRGSRSGGSRGPRKAKSTQSTQRKRAW
ncbi:MAG: DEAD/DEAH box helicase [Candidatus Magasanikbacteria bacterium CG_4_9_14_0_2_um_filter_42_11]|uniref:DEAD/DEAH box helicase n=1 Tax=Candidatus Magasanikbacteria bacterium CG_4_9_14_0_2_um_filter_42_11 TaxID=1974643 RepID=A0A2M8F9P7_9BACT|nr:MAG: DEAD/DEAH box helicase [Candidatus Magasanikbacteria bacterium CG10_big_fil_rev_8_21_14_0_10_43_9]PJC52464.1 MAG: DEAD/DEAH box helicase [Candidatus Magasanikbacteria bacterium CG_4_9_14_0_2_um_filter_42_11]